MLDILYYIIYESLYNMWYTLCRQQEDPLLIHLSVWLNNLTKQYFWSTFEVIASVAKCGFCWYWNGSEKNDFIRSSRWILLKNFNFINNFLLIHVRSRRYCVLIHFQFYWKPIFGPDQMIRNWLKIFSELQTRSQKKKRKRKIRGDCFLRGEKRESF